MLSSPFCPSPKKVCKEMVNLAQLKENEVVYDLGAGDGRLLFEALKAFNVKAVGVEISKERADYIINKASNLGFKNRIRVINDDFMNVSLRNADVLLLYLSPKDLALLRPKFELELKKGCRIVSHDFKIPNWKPKEILKVNDDKTHWLYLYQV
jgi:16S rRNA A1518/A1519 N6-dimethyltransferase RsmA/KsgA/DIM1 with predicted DNA glycosylase/AP lyase activity